MQEMTASTWKRTGSSIIWHPALLADLVRDVEPTPLRTMIGWLKTGFPENPPGGGRTVLVGVLWTWRPFFRISLAPMGKRSLRYRRSQSTAPITSSGRAITRGMTTLIASRRTTCMSKTGSKPNPKGRSSHAIRFAS